VLAHIRTFLTSGKECLACRGASVRFGPGRCLHVVVMNRAVSSVNPQLRERVGMGDVRTSPVIAGEEDHAKERQAPQET
jgi:hypothetical protein